MKRELQVRLAGAMADAGTRLVLAEVACQLGVSWTQVGQSIGLSGEAARALATYGWFPRRSDPELVRHAIRGLLADRGASPLQLATLFDPISAHAVLPREPIPDPRKGRRTAAPAGEERNNACEVDVLIQKQTMTPETARHFKLFRNPFDGPVEKDNQLFVSSDIAYAREFVWQVARNSSFAALVGESGAGKTTLLDDLAERLNQDGRNVVLIKPSIVGMEERGGTGHMLRSADLLHAVIDALDGSNPVPQGLQARTTLAARLLSNSVRAGNVHLLAIEEAHRMPESTLRHLKRLHELREGRRPLLGILLLGQPELQRRLVDGLRNGTLREVAQRIELVQLPALGPQISGYLQCRAAAFGRELGSLVLPDAVPVLRDRLTAKVGQHKIDMAYPLSTNNVVTRALNLAAQIGAPVVTADVVKAI